MRSHSNGGGRDGGRNRAASSLLRFRLFVRKVGRPCLDWSERRYHIAGHLGSEICRVCVERGWLARQRGLRARVTAAGRRGFLTSFGVKLPAAGTWK